MVYIQLFGLFCCCLVTLRLVLRLGCWIAHGYVTFYVTFGCWFVWLVDLVPILRLRLLTFYSFTLRLLVGLRLRYVLRLRYGLLRLFILLRLRFVGYVPRFAFTFADSHTFGCLHLRLGCCHVLFRYDLVTRSTHLFVDFVGLVIYGYVVGSRLPVTVYLIPGLRLLDYGLDYGWLVVRLLHFVPTVVGYVDLVPGYGYVAFGLHFTFTFGSFARFVAFAFRLRYVWLLVGFYVCCTPLHTTRFGLHLYGLPRLRLRRLLHS